MIAAGLLAPRPAPASPILLPRVPPVYLLRLEGQLRPPRPTDRGTTDLWLAYRGKTYPFQLTQLRVLNSGRLPDSILAAVDLYRPSFYLYGADTMLQRLAGAGPEARVTITGYYGDVGRGIMVSELDIQPPPSATAQPPPRTPVPH